MDKFEFCKVAHQDKDHLMAKMIKAESYKRDYPDMAVPAEYNISMDDMMLYLVNRAICKDNMHEATREAVWEPVNAKMREADGLTEPKFMTEHAKTVEHLDHSKMSHSEFTERIKGKDIHKVMDVLAEFLDTLSVVDVVKYRALMSEIDRI